jgi:hypothetical protein
MRAAYDYSNLLIEAKLNILCGSFEEHTHFTYARTVNLLHLSFMYNENFFKVLCGFSFFRINFYYS